MAASPTYDARYGGFTREWGGGAMRRLLTGAAVVAVFAAAASMTPVSAATTGVGQAKAATSLLQVSLGDGKLLHVRILGDDSTSTTDPKDGSASAFSRLSPLDI